MAQVQTTMAPVMDYETAEHFYNWLERDVPDDEQHEVEQRIHGLLRDYPEMVDTHSWPEMNSAAVRLGYHD